MYERPVIYVKQARKTLGEKATNLSDADVLELINTLDEIAKVIISDFKVLKSSEYASVS